MSIYVSKSNDPFECTPHWLYSQIYPPEPGIVIFFKKNTEYFSDEWLCKLKKNET